MEREENIFFRFLHFLRRIHLFGMCFSLAWGIFVPGMSLLLGAGNFRVEVPQYMMIGCWIVISVASLAIQYRWLENERTTKMFWIYNIWNYVLPVAACAANLLLFDSLYSFGGMMSGLEALGYYIMFFFIGGVAVLGGAVFNLVYFIKRKRERNRIPEQTEKKNVALQKVTDGLNVLVVLSVVIAAAGFGITYGMEVSSMLRTNKIAEENTAFRDEILKENSDVLDEEAILGEGLTYAMAVEAMADGKIEVTTSLSVTGKTNVSEHVLQQGIDRYREICRKFEVEGGVEAINQEIVFDGVERKIFVSSQFGVIDNEKREYKKYHAVVVFDEYWNVADIYYQERELSSERE